MRGPGRRITRRSVIAAAGGLTLAAARAFAEGAGTGTEEPVADDVQVPSDGGSLSAYCARPAGAGPFPVVLVMEDGSGVHGWIAGVCRRLAKAGYLALAPEIDGEAADDQVMQALDSCASWAGGNGGDPARLGVTGFGRGGRAVWLYDAHSTALKAAVAWYGPVTGGATPTPSKTALDVAADVHAPLLGLYGKDDRSTREATLLRLENKAEAAGRTVQIVVYVGAGPDFAAEGRPAYRKAAALDGWDRMLAWFKQYGVA